MDNEFNLFGGLFRHRLFDVCRKCFSADSVRIHNTRLRLIYRKVRRDPRKLEYMDLALEPVTSDEIETRELFQSEAAHNYLDKVQRNEKLRQSETV